MLKIVLDNFQKYARLLIVMLTPEKLDKAISNYFSLSNCYFSYFMEDPRWCYTTIKPYYARKFGFTIPTLIGICKKHFIEVSESYELEELDEKDLFYLRIIGKL